MKCTKPIRKICYQMLFAVLIVLLWSNLRLAPRHAIMFKCRLNYYSFLTLSEDMTYIALEDGLLNCFVNGMIHGDAGYLATKGRKLVVMDKTGVRIGSS